VRLALLDTVVASNASGQMDQQAWEDAFGGAARSLRVRVLADAEQLVRSAAAHSHYPSRRLQALLPDAEAADAMLNRLLAAGMPLERFEGLGDDPISRRARAAALETAWDGAVQIAGTESLGWRAIAANVAAWRPSTLFLWVVTAAILTFALLIAAWLSGELPSPAWFHPINELWWRLWP
jgi:hypothetical protein